jgi:hypothetical protein
MCLSFKVNWACYDVTITFLRSLFIIFLNVKATS